MIDTFGWFIQIRDLQKWMIPNKSEQEILDMSTISVHANIRQMKMEGAAIRDRKKQDQKEAEIAARNKTSKSEKPKPSLFR